MRLPKSREAAANDGPSAEIAIRDRDGLAGIVDGLQAADPSFAARPLNLRHLRFFTLNRQLLIFT